MMHMFSHKLHEIAGENEDFVEDKGTAHRWWSFRCQVDPQRTPPVFSMSGQPAKTAQRDTSPKSQPVRYVFSGFGGVNAEPRLPAVVAVRRPIPCLLDFPLPSLQAVFQGCHLGLQEVCSLTFMFEFCGLPAHAAAVFAVVSNQVPDEPAEPHHAHQDRGCE